MGRRYRRYVLEKALFTGKWKRWQHYQDLNQVHLDNTEQKWKSYTEEDEDHGHLHISGKQKSFKMREQSAHLVSQTCTVLRIGISEEKTKRIKMIPFHKPHYKQFGNNNSCKTRSHLNCLISNLQTKQENWDPNNQ